MFEALTLVASDQASADRLGLAAWVWIPGLAVSVVLGWLGFQRSKKALAQRALPPFLAVVSAVALLVVAQYSSYLDGILALAPPVILAALSRVPLRASPYWAACILLTAAVVSGAYTVTATGPLDSAPVLVAGVTTTINLIIMTAATVVLLATTVVVIDFSGWVLARR